MSGPTWKFWRWRGDDWMFVGMLSACALMVVASIGKIALLWPRLFH